MRGNAIARLKERVGLLDLSSKLTSHMFIREPNFIRLLTPSDDVMIGQEEMCEDLSDTIGPRYGR